MVEGEDSESKVPKTASKTQQTEVTQFELDATRMVCNYDMRLGCSAIGWLKISLAFEEKKPKTYRINCKELLSIAMSEE